LRADAIESIACGWLSLVVVIGLAAQLALRVWWVDHVASLVAAYFLVKEGRESLEGRGMLRLSPGPTRRPTIGQNK
jgi:divalent metal cation (Fe/Co/Zn/Cd) transporter